MTANTTTSYALSSCDYIVWIYDQNNTPTQVSCFEVTGLNREYETVIYKHGFSFVMGYFIIQGEIKPINITLKRVMINKDCIDDIQYLNSWFEGKYEKADGSTRKNKSNLMVDARNIDIVLQYGSTATPIVKWSVLGAVPVKMTPPQFSSGSTDACIETLELIGKDMTVSNLYS